MKNDNSEDIRWKQRFSNYQKALALLILYDEKETLSEMERQGLIKAFEFTYELGWNTLKDYLDYQGITGLIGSRDTIRSAFKNDLIADGEGWMDMQQSRNKTSHTYNEEVAAEIAKDILNKYLSLFRILEDKMTSFL